MTTTICRTPEEVSDHRRKLLASVNARDGRKRRIEPNCSYSFEVTQEHDGAFYFSAWSNAGLGFDADEFLTWSDLCRQAMDAMTSKKPFFAAVFIR